MYVYLRRVWNRFNALALRSQRSGEWKIARNPAMGGRNGSVQVPSIDLLLRAEVEHGKWVDREWVRSHAVGVLALAGVRTRWGQGRQRRRGRRGRIRGGLERRRDGRRDRR